MSIYDDNDTTFMDKVEELKREKANVKYHIVKSDKLIKTKINDQDCDDEAHTKKYVYNLVQIKKKIPDRCCNKHEIIIRIPDYICNKILFGNKKASDKTTSFCLIRDAYYTKTIYKIENIIFVEKQYAFEKENKKKNSFEKLVSIRKINNSKLKFIEDDFELLQQYKPKNDILKLYC